MTASRMLVFLLPVAFGAHAPAQRTGQSPEPALRSVALRVNRTREMVAFYSEAFGMRFRSVDARGITSQFGTFGNLTIKFVPIRDAVDFTDFPVHQLGFAVADIGAVIRLAERHGGRLIQPPEAADGGGVQAAIRDPDGNTLELYAPR